MLVRPESGEFYKTYCSAVAGGIVQVAARPGVPATTLCKMVTQNDFASWSQRASIVCPLCRENSASEHLYPKLQRGKFHVPRKQRLFHLKLEHSTDESMLINDEFIMFSCERKYKNDSFPGLLCHKNSHSVMTIIYP